jgi:hypothetical protein
VLHTIEPIIYQSFTLGFIGAPGEDAMVAVLFFLAFFLLFTRKQRKWEGRTGEGERRRGEGMGRGYEQSIRHVIGGEPWRHVPNGNGRH